MAGDKPSTRTLTAEAIARVDALQGRLGSSADKPLDTLAEMIRGAERARATVRGMHPREAAAEVDLYLDLLLEHLRVGRFRPGDR